MNEYVIVALSALALAIQGGFFLVARREDNERHDLVVKRMEDRVDDLLDRIQAPDLETLKTIQAPVVIQPEAEYLWDDTGLVAAEIEPE